MAVLERQDQTAILINTRVDNSKVKLYILDAMQAYTKAQNGIKLQNVVTDFNGFLKTDLDVNKYHRHDTLQNKFRCYLESFPGAIKIEYHTGKQRRLLGQWTGKYYTIAHRDIAYTLFYETVYKAFRALCLEYGITFSVGSNGLYVVK